jgi:hypothetical protein
MRYHLLLSFVFFSTLLNAQERWQQRVKYKMDVNLNSETHVIKGKQSAEYFNNSPDTLKVIYYHLYWNAFQPGSMMDVRNRELGRRVVNGRTDWEAKVADKIVNLKPDETGYQKIIMIKMNGRLQKSTQYETILKVILDRPILPKTKALFETEFEARVPVQVRRSGRDNAEGVKYSMSQWYPKISEYDEQGWHPTPYIAREFYGIWGDYEVNITANKNLVIGASGYLQNPAEIGYGYEEPGVKVNRPAGNTLTWKFIAPNVHDFVWAADPDFKHVTKKVREGLVLHALYKISQPHLEKQFDELPARAKATYNNKAAFVSAYQKEWETVLDRAEKGLPYIEQHFGAYPYKQYSFIQGGDGGMEYPMATLLKGAGDGVVFHEWMHSWYQMMLGTNESLYAWMDEGFATFAENRVIAWIKGESMEKAQDGDYTAYFNLVKSEVEEPLTTHADQFESRYGYATSSYSKGAVFLEQLGYIIGAENRDKVLLEYYRKFRFRHPNLNDFMRISENVSGLQLDWYPGYFVNTTKTIDYGIDSLWQEGSKIMIRLNRVGKMPMPVDLMLSFKDGRKHLAYIPQYLMFGAKPVEDTTVERSLHEPWRWTHPNYVVAVEGKLLDLKVVEIDPSMRMADVDRKNNKLELNW